MKRLSCFKDWKIWLSKFLIGGSCLGLLGCAMNQEEAFLLDVFSAGVGVVAQSNSNLSRNQRLALQGASNVMSNAANRGAQAGENRLNREHAERLSKQRYEAKRKSGNIKSIESEWNAYKENQKGIEINIDFDIKNSRGDLAWICAYFYEDSGSKLMGGDGKFETKGGQVAVWKKIYPNYDSTKYDDFKLFIPHAQLDITEKGKKYLKFKVALENSEQSTLAISQYGSFWVNNMHVFREEKKVRRIANRPKPEILKPDARFTKINKFLSEKNGQGGFLFKVDFDFDNLQGKEIDLDLWVYDEEGMLRDSEGDTVMKTRSFKPLFKKTRYVGEDFFIGYENFFKEGMGCKHFSAYMIFCDRSEGDCKKIGSSKNVYFGYCSPKGRISDYDITAGVVKNGRKGIFIETDLEISHYDGDLEVIATFYNKNGNPAKDKNGRYQIDGNIAVSGIEHFNKKDKKIDNFGLFIPYSELGSWKFIKGARVQLEAKILQEGIHTLDKTEKVKLFGKRK